MIIIIIIIRYVKDARWQRWRLCHVEKWLNIVSILKPFPKLPETLSSDMSCTWRTAWRVLSSVKTRRLQSAPQELQAAVTLVGPAGDWHFFISRQIPSSNRLTSWSPPYHRHPFSILTKGLRLPPNNDCQVFWKEARCASEIWLQLGSACRDLVGTGWFVIKSQFVISPLNVLHADVWTSVDTNCDSRFMEICRPTHVPSLVHGHLSFKLKISQIFLSTILTITLPEQVCFSLAAGMFSGLSKPPLTTFACRGIIAGGGGAFPCFAAPVTEKQTEICIAQA